MKNNSTGIALIFSGPSGTGKSTVCAQLRAMRPHIHFSVSCTTRSPRGSEKDGVDYYFLTRDAFEVKLREKAFIEHAEVHGNFYGTLKEEVLRFVREGEDVLLDIDVQGAAQIRESAKHDAELARAVTTVFIAPPSFAELERRLRGRGTDNESVIQCRLQNAHDELAQWKNYDYLLVNNDSEACARALSELLNTLRFQTSRIEEPPCHDR